MAVVPAGQRAWKCPDCGSEILLPITKLDPLACDACLAKLQGTGRAGAANAPATQFVPGGILLVVGVGAGLLVTGVVIGFLAGRVSLPPPAVVRPTRPDEDTPSKPVPSQTKANADEPDESTRPGPGYKWVRGYTRRDGKVVKGYWAKDRKSVP